MLPSSSRSCISRTDSCPPAPFETSHISPMTRVHTLHTPQGYGGSPAAYAGAPYASSRSTTRLPIFHPRAEQLYIVKHALSQPKRAQHIIPTPPRIVANHMFCGRVGEFNAYTKRMKRNVEIERY